MCVVVAVVLKLESALRHVRCLFFFPSPFRLKFLPFVTAKLCQRIGRDFFVRHFQWLNRNRCEFRSEELKMKFSKCVTSTHGSQAMDVFMNSPRQTAVDLRRMHSHPISAAYSYKYIYIDIRMRHAMCSYKNEKPGDGNGNENEKEKKQHQRSRSSSMTKSNRNTTRPFFGRCVLSLAASVSNQKWNVFSWRWCCRWLHRTYAHRPNARTHRYGVCARHTMPVHWIYTRAMQQMCFVDRTK